MCFFANAGDGNDSISIDASAFSYVGPSSLRGDTGNDTLVAPNQDDFASYVDGGIGNDSLVATGAGGAGAIPQTTLSYLAATGAVTVDLGSGRAYGADGNDSFSGFLRAEGSNSDDSLLGGASREALLGGGGNDTLDGGIGDDWLSGGGGINWASYARATDSVTVNLAAGISDGADGIDNLQSIQNVLGGNSADEIRGNNSANLLDGGSGAGNDTLNAFGGNDTLIGGLGDDSVAGGSGTDWASYANASSGITVNLGVGTSSGADGNDSLTGIENVLGGNGNDFIQGNSLANVLNGGAGDDTISGGAGNDLLDFGAGNENYLRGASETGNDTLIGGDGNDTLDLQANWSFLSESGGFSLYQDEADTIYAQSWESVVCFAEGTRIVTPSRLLKFVA